LEVLGLSEKRQRKKECENSKNPEASVESIIKQNL
jgi:hypothetical protein